MSVTVLFDRVELIHDEHGDQDYGEHPEVYPETVDYVSCVSLEFVGLQIDDPLLLSVLNRHVAVGLTSEVEVEEGEGQSHGDGLATASCRQVDQERVGVYYGTDDDCPADVVLPFSVCEYFEDEEACQHVEEGEQVLAEILVVLVGR